MNIAFFDFDGTITKKDTLFDFIIFAVGYKTFVIKLFILLPWLVLYVLRIIPNWVAKEKVLHAYFGNWDIDGFNKCAHRYGIERIPSIVKPEMFTKITMHKNNNDTVVVVSASCENWVKPWCNLHGIECIATKLEVKEGKLTGKIAGKNCYGPEKVARIQKQYDVTRYDTIYAYGDSKGDREMLAMATVAHRER